MKKIIKSTSVEMRGIKRDKKKQKCFFSCLAIKYL